MPSTNRHAAKHGRLPEPYDTTMRAVLRYVTKTGPSDDARRLRMVADLADLFAQAAADRTPIHRLLGDPVEFADDFKANYGAESRIVREQRRLVSAVAAVASEEEWCPWRDSKTATTL
ncbi:DUF1048 domain-containing protein [Leifsonia shinshuensis]